MAMHLYNKTTEWRSVYVTLKQRTFHDYKKWENRAFTVRGANIDDVLKILKRIVEKEELHGKPKKR